MSRWIHTLALVLILHSMYMQMLIHLDWSCCFNQDLVLISKNKKKRKTEPCDRMAECCLPFWCSSCACSTRYHFLPPSLATFNKLFCIRPGAHNAASSLGFCYQGNRHPQRHPMTAQGERGGKGGRGRGCSPVLSPGCTRPLAFSPTHAAPFNNTHTHKMHKATVHLQTNSKREK